MTLPAALLVVFWWKRGTLSWRRDVLPLCPFSFLAAASGIFAAWMEINVLGAVGTGFDLPIVERGLLAARAIWFYLGKLLWPANLLFIYPRWEISPRNLVAISVSSRPAFAVGALWRLRGRWRGPLAGALFFIGTLFPLLGFFNGYLFLYTYVADHFQYLPSLGIIALVAAGIALLLDRYRLWGQPRGYAACLCRIGAIGLPYLAPEPGCIQTSKHFIGLR